MRQLGKQKRINEHLKEIELKTPDPDIRIGVLVDKEELDKVQIYYKMFNPNPDEPIWERRMTSIELDIDMIPDILKSAQQLAYDLDNEDSISSAQQ
jgi:hypothetical protein